VKRIIFSTAPIPAGLGTRLQGSFGGVWELILGSDIPEEIRSRVEILVAADTKWLNKLSFKGMNNLRLVQTFSAGIDALDFETIPKDVIVCGNVGAFAEPIAEHVFGMIECLAKNLVVRDAELKRSIFDQSSGMFLKGKTIGVVGTGGIGKAVARLAKAYGMTTLGVNSSGRTAEFFDHIESTSGLDHVMATSDVIVLAVPLTLHTLNLINKSKLDLMKKNCILINVGRGWIVNEKALYDHLVENPSFKAGIDVWWRYPEPGKPFAQDYPFFGLPNFLGSPHIADHVPESDGLGIESIVRNLERYLNGEPTKGAVKREDYLGLKSVISREQT